MAATEGKQISIRTEGLDKNGLLGDAKLTGSKAPATVQDVERIVLTVRDCFSKFVQEQLTYAEKETSASDQSIEQLTGQNDSSTQSSNASSNDSVKINAIDKRTTGMVSTLAGMSVAASTVASIKETTDKIKKPVGILAQLAATPNLMFNVIKLGIKAAFKALLSSPVLIFGLILAGTMVYKFLIKPFIDRFKAWIAPIKAAWEEIQNKIIELYDAYIQPVIEACTPYIEQVADFFKSWGQKIVEFWSNFDLKSEWNNIVGWGQDIWNDVTKYVGEMWDALKEAPGKVWKWVTEGVNDSIQWISDQFHDIIDGIKDWWDKTVISMRKALSWVPGLAGDAEINAELIEKLNAEGKKLNEERAALGKEYENAKTQEERDAIMKRMKRLDSKTDKFQEKVKSYNLSDKEITDANKQLKKDGKSTDGAFADAVNANKTGGKISGGGKVSVENNTQSMLFGDTKLKAAVDSSGNKELKLSPEQNKEFEERIKRVFAKNLENMKKNKEKKGEEFDEAAAIKELGNRVMTGIDILSKKTDKLKDGQISDADLKSALNHATRGGNKNAPQTKVVVSGGKSEPTPSRSVHVNRPGQYYGH